MGGKIVTRVGIRGAAAAAGNVEDLPTAGAVGTVPTSDGAGGLAMLPGGGGGSTIVKGSRQDNYSGGGSITVYNFALQIRAAGSIEYVTPGGNSILAASITAESGFTVVDPSGITDGTPVFSNSGTSRVVTIGWSTGTGSATISWTWNGVSFVWSLSKS